MIKYITALILTLAVCLTIHTTTHNSKISDNSINSRLTKIEATTGRIERTVAKDDSERDKRLDELTRENVRLLQECVSQAYQLKLYEGTVGK